MRPGKQAGIGGTGPTPIDIFQGIKDDSPSTSENGTSSAVDEGAPLSTVPQPDGADNENVTGGRSTFTPSFLASFNT